MENLEETINNLKPMLLKSLRDVQTVSQSFYEYIDSDKMASGLEDTDSLIRYLENFKNYLKYDSLSVIVKVEKILRIVDPMDVDHSLLPEQPSEWLDELNKSSREGKIVNFLSDLPNDFIKVIENDISMIKHYQSVATSAVKKLEERIKSREPLTVQEYFLNFSLIRGSLNDEFDRVHFMLRRHDHNVNHIQTLKRPVAKQPAQLKQDGALISLLRESTLEDGKVIFKHNQKEYVIGFTLESWLALERVALQDALKDKFRKNLDYRDKCFSVLRSNGIITEVNENQEYKQKTVFGRNFRLWLLNVNNKNLEKACETLSGIEALP